MVSAAALAAVAAGGAIGSVSRYLVSAVWLPPAGPFAMPWGTLLVNVLGSFLFGLLFTVLSQYAPHAATLRVALLAGFLGGCTTFSRISFETVRLFQEGQPALAIVYVLASVLSCLLAVWFGLVIVKP